MSEVMLPDSLTRSNIQIKKDTRRSCLVCLGAVLLVGFATALNNSFGVLFVSLIDEFKGDRSKVAWIGSFEFIWYMLISPVCYSLTRSFGFRRVVFVGNLFFALGLLSTSFARDLGVMYITYGLLFGTGSSILYISSVIVLPCCFHNHLSTAYGITLSANGIFTLWFGPVYEKLMSLYGWRLTLKILTVLTIPIGVACCFFPKKGQISLEELKESKTKISVSLLRVIKNQAFVLWILIMFLVYLGFLIPFVHLISFSKDIGIAPNIGVYSISFLCAFDSIGKQVIGKLLYYFHWNIFTVNSIALLVIAVTSTLLPLTRTAVHLFLLASFYGMALGIQSLSVFLITPQLCEPEDAKQAITYVFAAMSIPGGIGGVIAAWIYDTTKSYNLAFFIAGGLFATASCLSILLPSLIGKVCCTPSELHCKNREDIINTKMRMPLKEYNSSQTLAGEKLRRECKLEYLTVV